MTERITESFVVGADLQWLIEAYITRAGFVYDEVSSKAASEADIVFRSPHKRLTERIRIVFYPITFVSAPRGHVGHSVRRMDISYPEASSCKK